MSKQKLKSNYKFDSDKGEASGKCNFCKKWCVVTDNFGRDGCIKLIDDTQQTPEVLGVWCNIDCLLNWIATIRTGK
jgi:hypothetical protein